MGVVPELSEHVLGRLGLLDRIDTPVVRGRESCGAGADSIKRERRTRYGEGPIKYRKRGEGSS